MADLSLHTENLQLPSRFQIGDTVRVEMGTAGFLTMDVSCIEFTKSTVEYGFDMGKGMTAYYSSDRLHPLTDKGTV